MELADAGAAECVSDKCVFHETYKCTHHSIQNPKTFAQTKLPLNQLDKKKKKKVFFNQISTHYGTWGIFRFSSGFRSVVVSPLKMLVLFLTLQANTP